MSENPLVFFQKIWESIKATRGGGETIQSIRDDQNAMLDLARSAQSGSYTPVTGVFPLFGADLTLYEELDTSPFYLANWNIDLTTLLAGEQLQLKIWLKTESGGAYTKCSLDAAWLYTGVADPLIRIFTEPIFNMYSIKITGSLAAAANRLFKLEYFDAKRGV
jgi:hypothetical protein